MVESNIRECKVCFIKKQRIFDGKYPNNRDKKWKDEAGLLWNGNICGKCNRDRVMRVMQKVRKNA